MKAFGACFGFDIPPIQVHPVGGGHSGPRESVFHDLGHGDNDLGTMIPPEAGGGAPLGCCSARPGFDLVSGWRSPKLAALDRVARRAARRR